MGNSSLKHLEYYIKIISTTFYELLFNTTCKIHCSSVPAFAIHLVSSISFQFLRSILGMVRSAPSDDDDGDGDGGDGGGSSVEYSNSNQFDLDLDNDLADGLFGSIDIS